MEEGSTSRVKSPYMRLITFYQKTAYNNSAIGVISTSRPEVRVKEPAIRVIASRPQDELKEYAIQRLFVRPEDRLRHRRSFIIRDKSDDIQKRLQSLIQGAHKSWTYAIFWQVSRKDHMNSPLLNWRDGYFDGEKTNSRSVTSLCMAKQEHRKKIFRELSTLLGDSVPNLVPEGVSDARWFFHISTSHCFLGGNGIPGRAFYTSSPIWVNGTQNLASLNCTHASEAGRHGIQTLACIPFVDGVVELGSSALIFPNSEFDLLDRMRSLIKFKNMRY